MKPPHAASPHLIIGSALLAAIALSPSRVQAQSVYQAAIYGQTSTWHREEVDITAIIASDVARARKLLPIGGMGTLPDPRGRLEMVGATARLLTETVQSEVKHAILIVDKKAQEAERRLASAIAGEVKRAAVSLDGQKKHLSDMLKVGGLLRRVVNETLAHDASAETVNSTAGAREIERLRQSMVDRADVILSDVKKAVEDRLKEATDAVQPGASITNLAKEYASASQAAALVYQTVRSSINSSRGKAQEINSALTRIAVLSEAITSSSSLKEYAGFAAMLAETARTIAVDGASAANLLGDHKALVAMLPPEAGAAIELVEEVSHLASVVGSGSRDLAAITGATDAAAAVLASIPGLEATARDIRRGVSTVNVAQSALASFASGNYLAAASVALGFFGGGGGGGLFGGASGPDPEVMAALGRIEAKVDKLINLTEKVIELQQKTIEEIHETQALVSSFQSRTFYKLGILRSDVLEAKQILIDILRRDIDSCFIMSRLWPQPESFSFSGLTSANFLTAWRVSGMRYAGACLDALQREIPLGEARGNLFLSARTQRTADLSLLEQEENTIRNHRNYIFQPLIATFSDMMNRINSPSGAAWTYRNLLRLRDEKGAEIDERFPPLVLEAIKKPLSRNGMLRILTQVAGDIKQLEDIIVSVALQNDETAEYIGASYELLQLPLDEVSTKEILGYLRAMWPLYIMTNYERLFGQAGQNYTGLHPSVVSAGRPCESTNGPGQAFAADLMTRAIRIINTLIAQQNLTSGHAFLPMLSQLLDRSLLAVGEAKPGLKRELAAARFREVRRALDNNEILLRNLVVWRWQPETLNAALEYGAALAADDRPVNDESGQSPPLSERWLQEVLPASLQGTNAAEQAPDVSGLVLFHAPLIGRLILKHDGTPDETPHWVFRVGDPKRWAEGGTEEYLNGRFIMSGGGEVDAPDWTELDIASLKTSQALAGLVELRNQLAVDLAGLKEDMDRQSRISRCAAFATIIEEARQARAGR